MMVRALHSVRIEVILDVVYNHEAGNLELPVGDVWGEARLVLPADLAGRSRNLLTGEDVETTGGDRGAALALSDAVRHAPVAMLRLEA
jgi:maltooligosyltrehalose synthase